MLGTVVVVGILVRLVGVASMSLWLDEAAIANVVSRGRFAEYLDYPASNRPLGYLVASGWLARVHNAEVVLRASSFLPSIAGLVLFALLARRLFRERGFAVLATLLVAFNPWSVSLAKDFKPYAAEQFVVLAWLVLVLRWRDRRGGNGTLLALGASIAAAPLFTHAPLLTVPPLTAVVLVECRRRGLWRQVFGIAACAGAAVVLAALQHRWIGSRTPPELFTTGSPSHFDPSRDALGWWLVERLVAILGDFVPLRVEPADPATSHGIALLALCLLGWLLALVRFVRRREWALLTLLVGPTILPALAGTVVAWPFGPERMNLYMVPLVVTTVLLGWESALGGPSMRWARATFLVAFLALQLPSDGIAYLSKPARFGNAREDIVPALTAMMHAEGVAGARPACLVFSQMSAYALRYYSRFHHRAAAVRAFLDRHPHEVLRARTADAVRRSVRASLERCDTTWIVLSHYGRQEIEAAREELAGVASGSRFEQDFVGTVLLGAGDVDPTTSRSTIR